MRVLFVTTQEGAPWGGSEVLWSHTALHLASLGHEVHASVPGWEAVPRGVEALAAAGVRVHRRELGPRPRPRWRRWLSRLRPAPTPARTCLERIRPEWVVISQGYQFEGALWMDACRLAGLPYGVIVQAGLEHCWPRDEEAKEWRARYEEAHGAYFVARENLALVESQLAVKLPQAEVVRNPFQVDHGALLPWPQVDAEGTLRLASVGRLHPASKGQDLLLRVLAREVWRSRPVELSFFGTGPNEASLRALADLLGVKRVAFRGHVESVASIWQEHHALVLPSRYEGLPLVVVEAMLCGRPCVVTRVAGNAELIEHGVDGFVAEGATVEALGVAMEAFWRSRHDLAGIGAAAARAARRGVPPNPAEAFAKRLLDRFGKHAAPDR